MAIFGNAVFIGFDLDGGEAFFLTIFSIEIAAKLYAFGLPEFFQKLWNVFDVIVVGAAIIVSIIGLFIRQVPLLPPFISLFIKALYFRGLLNRQKVLHQVF